MKSASSMMHSEQNCKRDRSDSLDRFDVHIAVQLSFVQHLHQHWILSFHFPILMSLQFVPANFQIITVHLPLRSCMIAVIGGFEVQFGAGHMEHHQASHNLFGKQRRSYQEAENARNHLSWFVAQPRGAVLRCCDSCVFLFCNWTTEGWKRYLQHFPKKIYRTI